ncbi:hypothetical protein [Rhodoferax saidenbachensis]|uniref:Uncharacterized protein n=1 Tax=Rhodoferax saidenbachensis TaxID=1484693 RepID=A0ABU1ZQR0_9BURK|nr:hypothetical protein [Rhodoferax saidenbachensis]MDR7307888.1 hypothetical protein [Rhodoferax saidenbachensis]
MPTSHRHSLLATTVLMALGSNASHAQTQVVKPPVAQYWMDVATVRMADMDELPNLGTMGGLAASMAGVKGMGDNSFGATKGMMPGRWLDIAVTTQRKPAGTTATQTIPPGLNLGASLTLLPPEPVASKPAAPQGQGTEDNVPEQPKGRILLYWGCGDTVRAGQPKVLDLANTKPEDYAKFMLGRATRERGATAAPGNAIWPNPQNKQLVPKGASLVGDHKVAGDGIPASLQFGIGQVQDFMPPLTLAATGGGAAAASLAWPAQPQARAYFLNAMGGSDGEMVLWSSAETPEPGWGLMDYLSTPNLDKWLADKTLLPTSQTQCAIPAGIFAKSKGAMVRGIAYGQELNLVYPPRPTDKKVPWAPDWAARVRVKSVATLPLDAAASGRAEPPAKPDVPDDSQSNKSLLPAVPGVPGLGNVLKGLFGR